MADEVPLSFKNVTGSGNNVLTATGPGNFYGLIVDTTTAAWRVQLFDNTAQSGTVLFDISGAAAASGNFIIAPYFIPFHVSCSVSLTNTARIGILFTQ